MRFAILVLALLAAACAAPGGSATNASLVASDPATALITGERVAASWRTQAAPEGQDPLVTLTLTHADGRRMAFQQGNHVENDLRAQTPGGPLAQIMGLFGDEAPVLYHSVDQGSTGAPFICGPDGPAALGLLETAEGETQIVGLKQFIQFETRADGVVEAVPYSPDMVCARLRFTRG
ncbi:MAG: hypothetical protein AB7G05_02580 [Hyphomonadaceae bacterium]